MLVRFVYLDEPTLQGYVAQLDDGLLAETKVRLVKKSSKSGNVDVKFAGFKAEVGNENERFWTMSFPPEAQFRRLLAAAYDDPDALAWVDVVDPSSDFKDAQVGEIIAWECDLDIDQSSRLAAKDGAGVQLLGLVGHLASASATGLQLGNGSPPIPEEAARQAAVAGVMQRLLESLNITRIVVGRDPGTDWSIFGPLYGDHLRSENIDSERLIVVGKIKRIVPQGKFRKLLDTEALNMMQMLQKGETTEATPTASANQYEIRGPALELDILAIYR
ncbi:DUF6414 family protein [Mycobacteroides abscessus]|uniref:DUF6414 family protein n=1 Tax=Mycobacteroides abscessus TaxID=36809 RepID=UPI00078E08B7|nr:hypothetical protein [Mycobacteroides abscessus]AMU69846.1 hypothetical protein A3O05_07145 [Mycobacteroides abscessus]MCU8692405.1 hypothetical protein [Mycobacteroides abscessus]MCU8711614.1 hypothetical protein [Mycobacteroides abscessus]MCU8716360.1 hypothetical protein [Mycobacteroides abscessus]MCU8750375.1 hypothetical protein [Mycobacteroides abscessus]